MFNLNLLWVKNVHGHIIKELFMTFQESYSSRSLILDACSSIHFGDDEEDTMLQSEYDHF